MAGSRPSATTSRTMAAVKSRDTEPEMRLRRALFAAGFRTAFRFGICRGRPDIVFTSRRVAVFVDGDFWHGNEWRNRGFESLEAMLQRWSNSSFWISKIRGNIERDRLVNDQLGEAGWTVVRIWESDVTRDSGKLPRGNPAGAASGSQLERRGPGPRSGGPRSSSAVGGRGGRVPEKYRSICATICLGVRLTGSRSANVRPGWRTSQAERSCPTLPAPGS